MLDKRKPTYEELELRCQRQAQRIRGLRKALKNLEKKHGYAALRKLVETLDEELDIVF